MADRKFLAHIIYICRWNISLSGVTCCLFIVPRSHSDTLFLDFVTWIVERKEEQITWFDEAGHGLHRGKKRELCRKREGWKGRPCDEESCGSRSIRKEKLWKGLEAQDKKAWLSWGCRQCGCGMEQKMTSVAEFSVENNVGHWEWDPGSVIKIIKVIKYYDHQVDLGRDLHVKNTRRRDLW